MKKVKKDASWLPATRGKAFKMVSQLLYDLPPGETYRIIFMERDLEETIRSQEKMLERLGRRAAPTEEMKHAFVQHLERLHEWLTRQPNMAVLRVVYRDLVERPCDQAEPHPRLPARQGGRRGDGEGCGPVALQKPERRADDLIARAVVFTRVRPAKPAAC